MALGLLDDDETRTVSDVELMGAELGDESVSYTVRLLTKQVWRRLRAECMRKRPTGGQGMSEGVDTEKFADAIYDYTLIGWEGWMFRGNAVSPNDLVQQSGATVKAKALVDETRKSRLIDIASSNVTVDAAARDHSFRSPA